MFRYVARVTIYEFLKNKKTKIRNRLRMTNRDLCFLCVFAHSRENSQNLAHNISDINIMKFSLRT